jgi:hypothetical protein
MSYQTSLLLRVYRMATHEDYVILANERPFREGPMVAKRNRKIVLRWSYDLLGEK